MTVFDCLKERGKFFDRKAISRVLPRLELTATRNLYSSSTEFLNALGVATAYIGVADVDFLDKDIRGLSNTELAEFVFLGVTLEHEKHHVYQLQDKYQRSSCDVDMLKDYILNRDNAALGEKVYWFQLPETDAYRESAIKAREWLSPITGEDVFDGVVCHWYNSVRYGEPIVGWLHRDYEGLLNILANAREAYHGFEGVRNCDVSRLDNDLVKRYVEAGSVDNDAIIDVMKNPSPDRKQRDMLAAMSVVVNSLYETWFPVLKNDDAMGRSYCQWRDRFKENVPEQLRMSDDKLDELIRNAKAEAREHVAINLVWSLPFVDKLEQKFDDFGL